jgi:hypothetical protein
MVHWYIQLMSPVAHEQKGLTDATLAKRKEGTNRSAGNPMRISITFLTLMSARSLLKIPFAERVDHSKKRTLRLRFLWRFRSAPMSGQPKVGSVASSRALRPQFRDTDQVEGRAAEHEQPVHLRQSA